jgi:ParB-like chromosome segregation protein Spo0J
MSNKLEIKYVNIEDIKPYENNPRFNDNAVEYVKNSIKEFGFKVPMILDKDNKIVTGHTRYKASLELGIKEIPVIYADDLTEEQIKAFRLADNKVSELSQWNYDLLDEELDNIININMEDFDFTKLEEIDLDSFFEEQEEKKTKEAKKIQCPHCGGYIEI